MNRKLFLVFFLSLFLNVTQFTKGQDTIKLKGAILSANRKSFREVALDIYRLEADRLEFFTHKEISLQKNSMFELDLERKHSFALRFSSGEYYTVPSIIYLPSTSEKKSEVMLNVFLEKKKLRKQYFIFKNQQGDFIKNVFVNLKDQNGFELKINLQTSDYILLNESQKYTLRIQHPSYLPLNIINFQAPSQNNDPVVIELSKQLQKFILEDFFFAVNEWKLQLNKTKELKELAIRLIANPTLNIHITCHEDARGDDDYNLWLSTKRAKAITSFLIDKGIASNRIIAVGKGEEELLNECGNGIRCSNKKHKENQRIEVAFFHP